jgi:hypothetical protein
MTTQSPEPARRPIAPAAQSIVDAVATAGVRRLCQQLVEEISNLHRDVELTATDVDIQAEIRTRGRARPLCRIVPYRELIHVQVGSDPMWESRVRDEAGYFAAIDMILRTFLRTFGS